MKQFGKLLKKGSGLNKHLMLIALLSVVLNHSAWAGINLYGAYSLADQAKGEISSVTETDKVGSAFMLGIDYSQSINSQLGFTVGGLYAFQRTFTSSTLSSFPGVVFTYADPKPKFSAIILQGNLNYRVMPSVYVLGGLNFPLLQTENFSTVEISGKLGLQFGAGYQLADTMAVEGMYRILNVDAKQGSVSFDNYALSGFELLFKYSL